MVVFLDELRHMFASSSSKDDQIYQRIGAQAVGSVNRDAGNLAQQASDFVDAGGMELVHLHILQRNASRVGNRHTVAHTGKGVAGHTPGTTIAASCEEYDLAVEGVDLACADLHRHHSAGSSLVQQ